MKTKEKVNKLHPFDRVPEWSVRALHKVNLHINYCGTRDYYRDGDTLDVEHKNGAFLGLGIYSPDKHTCFYWSDWLLAKHVIIPKFAAHNGVSDLMYLKEWGFKVDNSHLIYDTYLIEHVIDSSQRDYSLTTLTKKRLGYYYPDFKEICGKDKTFADYDPKLIAEKNACDTYYTYKLMEHQKCRLY